MLVRRYTWAATRNVRFAQIRLVVANTTSFLLALPRYLVHWNADFMAKGLGGSCSLEIRVNNTTILFIWVFRINRWHFTWLILLIWVISGGLRGWQGLFSFFKRLQTVTDILIGPVLSLVARRRRLIWNQGECTAVDVFLFRIPPLNNVFLRVIRPGIAGFLRLFWVGVARGARGAGEARGLFKHFYFGWVSLCFGDYGQFKFSGLG